MLTIVACHRISFCLSFAVSCLITAGCESQSPESTSVSLTVPSRCAVFVDDLKGRKEWPIPLIAENKSSESEVSLGLHSLSCSCLDLRLEADSLRELGHVSMPPMSKQGFQVILKSPFQRRVGRASGVIRVGHSSRRPNSGELIPFNVNIEFLDRIQTSPRVFLIKENSSSVHLTAAISLMTYSSDESIQNAKIVATCDNKQYLISVKHVRDIEILSDCTNCLVFGREFVLAVSATRSGAWNMNTMSHAIVRVDLDGQSYAETIVPIIRKLTDGLACPREINVGLVDSASACTGSFVVKARNNKAFEIMDVQAVGSATISWDRNAQKVAHRIDYTIPFASPLVFKEILKVHTTDEVDTVLQVKISGRFGDRE